MNVYTQHPVIVNIAWIRHNDTLERKASICIVEISMLINFKAGLPGTPAPLHNYEQA